MSCQRCGGLAVSEAWYDLRAEASRLELTRCVNCGWVDDPVIRSNRQYPDSPKELAPDNLLFPEVQTGPSPSGLP